MLLVLPRLLARVTSETNTVQLNEYEQSANEAASGGAAQTPNNVVALSAFGGGAGPGSRTDLVSWGDGGTDGPMGGSEEAMQLRPYNQRIELPSVDDSDWEGGRASGGGGGGAGGTGGGGGSGDVGRGRAHQRQGQEGRLSCKWIPMSET